MNLDLNDTECAEIARRIAAEMSTFGDGFLSRRNTSRRLNVGNVSTQVCLTGDVRWNDRC